MTTTLRSSGTIALRATPLSLLAGVVLGLGSFELESVSGSPVWLSWVHTLAPWTLPTVLIGFALRRHACLAATSGLVTQVAMVVAHYAAGAALTDRPLARGSLIEYTLMAVVTGPVFGLVGAHLHDPRETVRIVCRAIAGAPLVVDGLRQIHAGLAIDTRVVQHVLIGCIFVALGLELPAALGRSHRERAVAVAFAVAIAAVVIFGLDVVAVGASGL
jgi:hypothetical protein